MKEITREELRKRVQDSKLKEDILTVNMPKGTKERIYKYADNISKYCRELILKDLEKKDKVKNK